MIESYYSRHKHNSNYLMIRNQKAKEYYNNNIDKQLLKNSKRRANKKNKDFNIDISDIQLPVICPILNLELETNTPYAPSLDRIDNSKGYIKGNVQVISVRANLMKNDASIEELRDFARWVIKTYGLPEEEFQ